MRARRAKTLLSFPVFLASVASRPLELPQEEMAGILGISESTLFKLRHGRLEKIPAKLHPSLMAAKFSAEAVGHFSQDVSTALLFLDYAKLLNQKYIISDSLARFASLVVGVSPMDEERVKRLYGMIPELLLRCYEESYANSEREYARWEISCDKTQSEYVYQNICDALSRNVLDGEKLKQLFNLVCAEGVRSQLSRYFGDFSYLELVDSFVRSQLDRPFYNINRRSEQISIPGGSGEMISAVSAQEQIVAQIPQPVEFTLTQQICHFQRLPAEEIAMLAFAGLRCTVNGQPALDYINRCENAFYISLHQMVTAEEKETGEGEVFMARATFRFTLHPARAGEAIQIAYEYTAVSQLAGGFAQNSCYALQYPAKRLEHEIVLDDVTRRYWGVSVELFTPIVGGSAVEKQFNEEEKTGDSRHITFFDWAMPGSGYCRTLYELKGG